MRLFAILGFVLAGPLFVYALDGHYLHALAAMVGSLIIHFAAEALVRDAEDAPCDVSEGPRGRTEE
jgi:hypothetical protein